MLHITPDQIAAAYDLLRLTPPFRGWRLPPSDDVVFHAVPLSGAAQGEHYLIGDQHHIRISPQRHHTLASMIFTLAHEMVHMHEHKSGVRCDVKHGRDFKRLATQVCRHHGFDRGQF